LSVIDLFIFLLGLFCIGSFIDNLILDSLHFWL